MKHRRPAGDHRRRRREAGYNMVVMVMAVTVLSIMVAAVTPLWSQAIRRDKEEELIFRGLQYAEAIRVFQKRFGRLPVKLEELVEIKPRSIRRLWKDPMTESGAWGLIFAAPAAGQVGRPGIPGTPGAPPPGKDGAPPQQQTQIPAGSFEEEDEDGRTETGFGSSVAGPAPVGPIVGVYSRSTDESIKVFMERQKYNEWKFTVELLKPPGKLGGEPMPRSLSSRWIGRPFPGTLDEDERGGGKPKKKDKRRGGGDDEDD